MHRHGNVATMNVSKIGGAPKALLVPVRTQSEPSTPRMVVASQVHHFGETEMTQLERLSETASHAGRTFAVRLKKVAQRLQKTAQRLHGRKK
jgi:hypothetical protein